MLLVSNHMIYRNLKADKSDHEQNLIAKQPILKLNIIPAIKMKIKIKPLNRSEASLIVTQGLKTVQSQVPELHCTIYVKI